MIKVFTLNKNNKIELTKEELEQLLNESFWEGYRSHNNSNWVYTTPYTYTTTQNFAYDTNTITVTTNTEGMNISK